MILFRNVLLSVHDKRASYDPTRPFLPWLAAIARYRWLDHLRAVYRNAEDATEDVEGLQEGEEEALMARLSLDRMFVRIPGKQAEVIEMVKIKGLSIREAAARSGQSEAAVKVNIHRGLKRLSALIEVEQ
jgi:RNA polymerase sigma factor (sigma-70 family)